MKLITWAEFGNWKLPESLGVSGDARGSCCVLASQECEMQEKHKWQLAVTFTHTIKCTNARQAQVERTRVLADHHFLCKFNMVQKISLIHLKDEGWLDLVTNQPLLPLKTHCGFNRTFHSSALHPSQNFYTVWLISFCKMLHVHHSSQKTSLAET